MAFSNTDLEFYFLDDNNSPNPSVDWNAYRNALVWNKWGVRTSSSGGTVGNATETFNDLYNDNSEALSRSAFFLRGKYQAIAAAAGFNMTRDYIIDSGDALLGDNYPIYQYTWVAIQNRNTTSDHCYRMSCSSGRGPNFTPNPSSSVNDAQNYLSFRWMGIIDGSNLITLNNLLIDNFPHQASIQQRDGNYNFISEYNWWDALGLATASKKIFHGYNNQFNYNLNNTTFHPHQINRWIAENDSSNNPTGRNHHCIDIPAGKTAIGIVCITRDWQQAQQGDQSLNVTSASSYGWKYVETDCEFDYLVIA